MINIRPAGTSDARQMAELLNEIIHQGGTTAMTTPVKADGLAEWIGQARSSWHLAEDEKGMLKGFQWFAPHEDLPETSADIATFVRVGQVKLGIGSALFEASKKAAFRLGFTHFDAVIRADNEGGLAYYQSRGFETIRLLENIKLTDGTIVNKVWKRIEI